VTKLNGPNQAIIYPDRMNMNGPESSQWNENTYGRFKNVEVHFQTRPLSEPPLSVRPLSVSPLSNPNLSVSPLLDPNLPVRLLSDPPISVRPLTVRPTLSVQIYQISRHLYSNQYETF